MPAINYLLSQSHQRVNGVDTVFLVCKHGIFRVCPPAPNSNQPNFVSSNRSKALLSENRRDAMRSGVTWNATTRAARWRSWTFSLLQILETCFLTVSGKRTAILRSLNPKRGVALAVTPFPLIVNLTVGGLLPPQELGFLATTCTLLQLKISDWNLQSSDKFRFCVLQEETLHHAPLVCLRNRQADPPLINRRTAKEWRFLLEKIRVIVFFSIQTLFREDPPWGLRPIISRCFLQNRRILTLRVKPIGVMECWKAGSENSLISTCPERRIRERVIRDYRKGRAPKRFVFIQHCTCYVDCQPKKQLFCPSFVDLQELIPQPAIRGQKPQDSYPTY